MIVFDKVTFEASGRKILNDISFSIESGKIIGLVGPSGCGKTTLIKCLLGLNHFKGSIKQNNIEMPNRKEIYNISYMAQNDALYEQLSGYENMLFFARVYGIKNIKKRIDELLKIVDLEKDKNNKVINYSGGMKKRLSLAISLINDGKYMILDEPTVGIDPVLKKTLWELFEEQKKQGKTIFITTHVMDELKLCDDIIVMKEGVILAYGSKEKLLKDYQVKTIEEIFFKI